MALVVIRGARRCCRVTHTHTQLISSHYVLYTSSYGRNLAVRFGCYGRPAGRQIGPSVRSGNNKESGNTDCPGNTEKFQSHHGFSRASNRIRKVSFRIEPSRGTNRLELAEER